MVNNDFTQLVSSSASLGCLPQILVIPEAWRYWRWEIVAENEPFDSASVWMNEFTNAVVSISSVMISFQG